MGPLFGIGLLLTAVGTAKQVQTTNRANRYAKESTEIQKRQNRVNALRERRQAIREQVVQRARAVATAQALGAGSSSGISGGISSLGSQLGGAIGNQTFNTANNNRLTDLSFKSSVAQQQAQYASGIANLGLSVMGNTQGIQANIGT